MTQIYETMVLLDNDVVRTDWKKAKSIVTDTVSKYDGQVETCRRWDERRLAYPIKRKNRATFYLAYHAMPGEKIHDFLRDLEFNERVLRYLMVKVDDVPEEERKLSAEEEGSDYTVPAPPEDDAIEIPEEETDEGAVDGGPDAPPQVKTGEDAPSKAAADERESKSGEKAPGENTGTASGPGGSEG